MNKHIELGKINRLKVERVSEPGIYLVSQDEESVLLPNAYITQEMQIDTLLDVFIYTDSEDRLVATTLKPYVMVEQFALLEVVDVAPFGAFVDIGLPKDLLIPKNKQKSSYHVGDKKFIRVVEDERSGRLIGTEKFTSYLKKVTHEFKKNDEVEIVLYAKTPLGFKVVVNHDYEGMIFHTEIFENIGVGSRKKAYIKNVREDGKLDIILQKIGAKGSDENSNRVVEVLKENGGEVNFTYKSDAEDIKAMFGMSKKAFKATLTKLIESNIIILNSSSIKLNP